MDSIYRAHFFFVKIKLNALTRRDSHASSILTHTPCTSGQRKDSLNRWVFRPALKRASEEQLLRLTGREFHTIGAR